MTAPAWQLPVADVATVRRGTLELMRPTGPRWSSSSC